MKTKFLSIILIIQLLNSVSAQTRILSLKEALTLAKTGNRELQIQRMEEQRRKYQTDESRSNLLTNISANGSFSHYFNRQVIFLPGSFAGTEKAVQDIGVGGTEAFNASLSFSQPIFHPAAVNQQKASKIEEKIEKEKTFDVESKIAYQVSALYHGISLMKAEIEFRKKSLERQKNLLKDSKVLFSQAQALLVDTVKASIEVQICLSDISQLLSRLTNAENELASLLGLNESVTTAISDSLMKNIALESFPAADAMWQMAESQSSELKTQNLQVLKNEKELLSKKSERLPQVFIVGNYQFQSQSDDFNLPSYTWPRTSFVGLQISVPILTGGRTSSRINQSRIQVHQEKSRLHDKYIQIRNQIKSQSNNFADAKLQVAVHDQTRKFAERNYKIIYERYKNGLATRLELMDAELTLRTNENKYLHAKYLLLLSGLDLQKLTGTLSL